MSAEASCCKEIFALSAGAGAIWAPGEPYFALFRRKFEIGENVSRVLIGITAVSPEPARQFVFDLFFNGVEIGVGPSRLGRSPGGEGLDSGRPVLYYNTYDVTEIVRAGGQNEILVLCMAEEGKALLARVSYIDGSGQYLGGFDTSSEGWEAMNADPVFRPDNSIGTHYYKAYAANIDAVKWRASAGESGVFTAPVLKKGALDAYELTPSPVGPVKRYETAVPPENIRKTDEGYFIDLGREIVGSIRAKLEAETDSEIEVRFGEELNPDGSVRYAMRTGNVYVEHWRVGPGEWDIAAPDMMTYRYAEISAPVPFEINSINGLALRAGLDDSESSFDSDNPLLNELYDFTKYTVKATTQDLYVDSQSRERGAYEGDLLINMLASYTFYSETAVPRFTFEYLCTHRTWPAEYILLMPYICLLDLMQTGDLSAARRQYSVLKECNFAALKGPQGLVRSGNTAAQGVNAVLYDWPPSQRDGYDTNVLYPTVLNALQVKSFASMAEISGYLGMEEEKSRYLAAAGELAAAVNDTLYDSEKGAFCDGLYADGTRSTHFSQHASAYALWGLGNAFLRQNRLEGVCEYIRSANGLKTSVYGAFFLLDGLYRSGVPGAAALATSWMLSEHPGDMYTWAYMMHELGATISAEAWSPALKPNSTFSHPWGAAPAALIARGIFGIEPLEPGYSRFRVNFRRAGIGRASIVLPTTRGPVSASFCGDNYSVTGPEGCEWKVYINGEMANGKWQMKSGK
ncbi:MAG: family 78 glycoside hydrolase catalytic domain [Clostridia bacterium]|nr:family 78 glycoside hydrolase catalytic domain [Clostridia bacterium]